MLPKRNRRESNVSDAEAAVRSVLMRLYRCRIGGEAYYPAHLVGHEEAAYLEGRGWIGRREAGWVITESGVKAWAHLSAPVLKSKFRLGWQNEILHILGKDIVRMCLGATAVLILEALVGAGGEMAYATAESMGGVNYSTRGTVGLEELMTGVYVIHDGQTVRLTDVGWMVANEMGLTERMQKSG